MQKVCFTYVHQLGDGIFKYFEACGGARYHGECFVFDYRVGLSQGLKETASMMCTPARCH